MDIKELLSGKEFLNSVMRPYAELTTDLLRMVNSHCSGDPTYRFQIAAIIVFLSGVDKVLSVALQLMYLTGRIEWKWLVQGHDLEPGIIECHQGLTTKLNKLHSVGLDLTGLQWIVDIRNEYVHSCRLRVGYRVGMDNGDPPRLVLQASGPEISYPDAPLMTLGASEIQTYVEHLTDRLGKFLDENSWQTAWILLSERLGSLPLNPEPEYSQVVNGSVDEIVSATMALNQRYIGIGLQRLREQM